MRTVGWIDPAADKEPKKIIEEPVEAPAPVISEEPEAVEEEKPKKTARKSTKK